MLKLKMPDGVHTVLTSTGNRFQVDAKGHIEVDELTQDHFDLLQHGGVAAKVFDPEPSSVEAVGTDDRVAATQGGQAAQDEEDEAAWKKIDTEGAAAQTGEGDPQPEA